MGKLNSAMACLIKSAIRILVVSKYLVPNQNRSPLYKKMRIKSSILLIRIIDSMSMLLRYFDETDSSFCLDDFLASRSAIFS